MESAPLTAISDEATMRSYISLRNSDGKAGMAQRPRGCGVSYGGVPTAMRRQSANIESKQEQDKR